MACTQSIPVHWKGDGGMCACLLCRCSTSPAPSQVNILAPRQGEFTMHCLARILLQEETVHNVKVSHSSCSTRTL